MSKCVLQHCEFQHGGQCCLVCPKGLTKANEKKSTSKRILSWCKKMRKILPRLHGRNQSEDGEGLPRGVSVQDGKYIAYIRYNKKNCYLIGTWDKDEAIKARADAEKAKQNGDFPQWLKSFREQHKAVKTGKETAKKGGAL